MRQSPLLPLHLTWEISAAAKREVAALRLGREEYMALRTSLQLALCDYFTNGDCLTKGCNIAPIKSDIPGCKGLKMRWMLPGRGKSGGLRLAVLVFCEQRRVCIAGLFERKTDPTDEDFAAAFKAARPR
jgi:hypothetical protein